MTGQFSVSCSQPQPRRSIMAAALLFISFIVFPAPFWGYVPTDAPISTEINKARACVN